MILLVGLGNPGTSYQNTRHNIGFKMLDEFIQHFSLSGSWQKKFQGELFQTNSLKIGKKIILFKPQKYMNLSGPPVAACASFYKIPPENIFVFHDELNLPLNKVRVRQNGGAGGHNGIKSIDRDLGKNYWRIRIGIDHPGNPDRVHDYVLQNFSPSEMEVIHPLLKSCASHSPLLLQEEIDAYMNKIDLETKKNKGT